MRSLVTSLVCTTLLLLGGAPFMRAHAGTALTWKECVQKAAQSNPELLEIRAEEAAAEAALSAASYYYLPTVSGELYAVQSLEDTSDDKRFKSYLFVEQNIFNGFRDDANLAKARASRHAARINREIRRAKVSAELKTAFAEVIYASRATRLADEIVERRKQNLDLVQLRFESGHENKGALLLARAYLEESKLEAMQAKNSAVVARSRLATVLGVNDSESLDVQGEPPLSKPPPMADLPYLAADAPEIRYAQATSAEATAEVKVAKGALFPTLDLTGKFGRSDKIGFLPQEDYWEVELELSIPLFNGGKDYYGIREAQQRLAASTYSLESTRRQKILALREAHGAYSESIQKEKVDASFLEAVRTRAMIGRSKYNNGLLNFENWDDIENDLIDREKAALRSRRDRMVAEANWEQTLGKGAIP